MDSPVSDHFDGSLLIEKKMMYDPGDQSRGNEFLQNRVDLLLSQVYIARLAYEACMDSPSMKGRTQEDLTMVTIQTSKTRT